MQAIQATPFDITNLTVLIQEYLLHSGFDQTYSAFSQNIPSDQFDNGPQYRSTLAFRKGERSHFSLFHTN